MPSMLFPTAHMPRPPYTVWELGLPPMAFGLNQVHFLSLLAMAACPAGAVFFSLGALWH